MQIKLLNARKRKKNPSLRNGSFSRITVMFPFFEESSVFVFSIACTSILKRTKRMRGDHKYRYLNWIIDFYDNNSIFEYL